MFVSRLIHARHDLRLDRLAAHALEIVGEPPSVKIVDRRAGDGLRLQPETAALLEQARQFLGAGLAARATDTNVVGPMVVVPQVVDIPALLNTDRDDVATQGNIANHLEIWIELGANLVATRLHHPFFEGGDAFGRPPRSCRRR